MKCICPQTPENLRSTRSTRMRTPPPSPCPACLLLLAQFFIPSTRLKVSLLSLTDFWCLKAHLRLHPPPCHPSVPTPPWCLLCVFLILLSTYPPRSCCPNLICVPFLGCLPRPLGLGWLCPGEAGNIGGLCPGVAQIPVSHGGDTSEAGSVLSAGWVEPLLSFMGVFS